MVHWALADMLVLIGLLQSYEKPVLNLVTKKIELKNQYVKRILNG